MNATKELGFDLDSLVKFAIHNAVIHHQCFRHQVKYDLILVLQILGTPKHSLKNC